MQRWIEDGQVLVNSAVVRRSASRLALDDMIVVTLPPVRARREIAVADIPIDILHEDEHLLAVNKPPGIVVHPTHAQADGTLLNALAGYARGWPDGYRPSLLGRLDKHTSGVVLVAKTAAIHASAQRALASRASEKDYLAVVYGRPPIRGTIDLKLRRDSVDRRRVVASPTCGKGSVTQFERLSLMRVGPGLSLALLRCRLVTGRTHQIRVHLASSGWPIVGDPVYGKARWTKVEQEVLGEIVRTFPRQALHAWRPTFPHPVGGDQVSIEAPAPDDFAELQKHVG